MNAIILRQILNEEHSHDPVIFFFLKIKTGWEKNTGNDILREGTLPFGGSCNSLKREIMQWNTNEEGAT
jgi:hypothetical protein